MSNSQRCSHCDDYKQRGHNYCLMCGFHLTQGHVQSVRISDGYHINEKFCGYCGDPKHDCSC